MKDRKIIPRQLEAELLMQLKEFPIVTVLGPRQAGKTTLVRYALPDYDYVSLETPHVRSFAEEDPVGFLQNHPPPVIFDEIQRVPTLLSYLQGKVDEGKENGQYVLTGSHQLSLREAVSQSLAGRTGMIHLLPLSIRELEAGGIRHESFTKTVYYGFLPRVHDQKQRPHIAYGSYLETYVQRDVQQLIRLKDVSLFMKFLKLLAGRTAQVVDYSSLAGDVGVDAKTIRQWMSILEASYVIFKLPPYFENFGKRIIKSPKFYFCDTGLLCHLLGIEREEQVGRDPLVGHIFENLVVLECLKARFNRALQPSLYFYRDKNGREIDLILDSGRQLMGIEIKSSQTYHKDYRRHLDHFSDKVAPLESKVLIYSGEAQQYSDGLCVENYRKIDQLFS